jgi:hypothetical protein
LKKITYLQVAFCLVVYLLSVGLLAGTSYEKRQSQTVNGATSYYDRSRLDYSGLAHCENTCIRQREQWKMNFAKTTLLCTALSMVLNGCATSPNWPPPGPQQKVAPVSANQNCTIFCSVQITQSTALEDIKNNTGQVTAGNQVQTTTQTNTQSSTPTVTTSKNDGEPKP